MSEKSKSQRLVRGFILFMVVAALALGGVAWYFYAKDARAVRTLQSSYESVFKRAKDIREYQAPSIERYYRYVGDGSIPLANDALRDETYADLIQLANRQFGILEQNYKIRPMDPTIAPRQDKAYYSVSVTLVDVSRQVYESFLTATYERTKTYGTIEGLSITAKNFPARELDKAISEDSILWTVNFRVGWWESVTPAEKRT